MAAFVKRFLWNFVTIILVGGFLLATGFICAKLLYIGIDNPWLGIAELFLIIVVIGTYMTLNERPDDEQDDESYDDKTQKEERGKMMGEVYSVFAGVGKTWLYNHQKDYGIEVADSDSSMFKWRLTETGERVQHPEFPQNYIRHIKDIQDKYDYILVSTHKEVRDALKEAGIEYTLIYPSVARKDEYIKRYTDRPNNGFPVKVAEDLFETWVETCNNDEGASVKIVLCNEGQFLKDILPEHPLRR